MARLAVNVDHVATVRQARGIDEPDPVLAAGIAELAGADGIICHLREDRRHINDRDLGLLRQTVRTKLNLEMAAVEEMVDIARHIKPDLVTFVPERREELTTEGGLDVKSNPDLYKKVVEQLKESGIEVSFFVDPDASQIETAQRVGGDIVEIHTGHYSEARSEVEAQERFMRIAKATEITMSPSIPKSSSEACPSDMGKANTFVDPSLPKKRLFSWAICWSSVKRTLNSPS